MKYTIALMVLALAASTAFASPEQIKRCKDVGAIASELMQLRQGGVSLPDALDRAVDHEKQDVFLFLLQTAYRLPVVKDDKQTAVTAFRDQHILSCLASARQRR